MSHETIAITSHIGSQVPDEVAFPLILARLRSRTKVTAGGCWEHQGYVNRVTGYVHVFFKGKRWKIHRLSHYIHKGATELDVCHTCDNKRCWNPGHLWAGTHRENMIDHVVKGKHYESKKTECLRGHPLSGDNIYMAKLGPGRGYARKCRACERIRQSVEYRRKRGLLKD
jgi:hypothetical protein